MMFQLERLSRNTSLHLQLQQVLELLEVMTFMNGRVVVNQVTIHQDVRNQPAQAVHGHVVGHQDHLDVHRNMDVVVGHLIVMAVEKNGIVVVHHLLI